MKYNDSVEILFQSANLQNLFDTEPLNIKKNIIYSLHLRFPRKNLFIYQLFGNFVANMQIDASTTNLHPCRSSFALARWLMLCFISSLAILAHASQSLISFPRDRASSVAIVVRDLASGEEIAMQNPHKAMLPASTLKCITAAAAMEYGLDSCRIQTNVFIKGDIDSIGVLHGNLIIQGAGDPTTDSSRFPSSPSFVGGIAQAVKSKGITDIEGEILIDASCFPDDGPCDRWELSDLRYDYGAGLYSVNYHDNSRGDRAIESPGEAFGEALENKLKALGINVEWTDLDPNAPGQIIYTHQSPLGADIMHEMMVRSDNLFAEAMLRQLAPRHTRKEAIEKESRLLSNKGIALDISDIYDGSGLSRNNRITAFTLADVLEKMADKEGKETTYVGLFPVVGKEGTVKSLLKGTPLEGHLALKSGSMNGVHCYAGYKLDADNKPTHAIVIFVNDFFCKRAAVRDAIASFLLKTFPK